MNLYFQKTIESWKMKVDVVLPRAVLKYRGKDSFLEN